MLTIGPLAEDEAEAAVALWEAAGLTRPWNDAHADIRLALASPAATLLAGRVDGRLLATAMAGCDGHRGWVYYLAVGPEHRGQGWGRQMMRAAETWLAERGAPRLNLMVRGENAGARAFYERIGYRLSDVVVLQRDLSRILP